MRTWLFCGGSISTIAIAFAAQGCSALPDTCENRGTCASLLLEAIDAQPPGDDDSPASDAGTDSAVPQESDAADGAIAIDAGPCDTTKSPIDDACVLSEASGVFVSPTGDDATGEGSRAKPYASLAKAVSAALANAKRVYACAGTYAAPLAIGVEQDGAQIFGGLDCQTWRYTGEKARIAPAAPGIALAVDSLATGVSLTDVAIEALPAASAGASSIAVFASRSKNVRFTRVAIKAGDARDGATGTTFSNYDASDAPFGINAVNAAGAAAGMNACHDDTTSSAGGDGAMAGGAPARDGTCNPAIGDPNGGLSGNSQCKDGLGGADGAGITAGGLGASSSGGIGAAGWSTHDGSDGANGRPGQGGGGGGAKGVVAIGGGGGGAGGCGGGKGTGGHTGGSSIAVLAYQSTIALRDATLIAGNAGGGGNGGAGQSGQAGGDPGAGVCNGGPGGVGSGGSGGGGGSGGASAGILWSGTAPTIDGQTAPDAASYTSVIVGSAGAKGARGAGGSATATGAPGVDGAEGAAGFAKAIAQVP